MPARNGNTPVPILALVDQTKEVKGDDGTAASNVESLVILQ